MGGGGGGGGGGKRKENTDQLVIDTFKEKLNIDVNFRILIVVIDVTPGKIVKMSSVGHALSSSDLLATE